MSHQVNRAARSSHDAFRLFAFGAQCDQHDHGRSEPELGHGGHSIGRQFNRASDPERAQFQHFDRNTIFNSLNSIFSDLDQNSSTGASSDQPLEPGVRAGTAIQEARANRAASNRLPASPARITPHSRSERIRRFTVTATGSPTPTLSESGALPTGVTFNASTGILSGNPQAGTRGTYPITFTASNGVGSPYDQQFTLTVDAAPAITSSNNATFTVGTNGTFTVTATGFPAPTFSESGALPNGVTLNDATGVLSGTPLPNTGGTYDFTSRLQTA